MIDPLLATLLGGGALVGGLRSPRGNRVEGALRGLTRGGGIYVGSGLGTMGGLLAGGLGGAGLGAAIGGPEGVLPGTAIGGFSGGLAGLPLGGLVGYKLTGKMLGKPSWEREEAEGKKKKKESKPKARTDKGEAPVQKAAQAFRTLLKRAFWRGGLLGPRPSPPSLRGLPGLASAASPNTAYNNAANSGGFNKLLMDAPFSFADSIKMGPPPIGPIVSPKSAPFVPQPMPVGLPGTAGIVGGMPMAVNPQLYQTPRAPAAPSWMDALNSAVQGVYPGRGGRRAYSPL